MLSVFIPACYRSRPSHQDMSARVIAQIGGGRRRPDLIEIREIFDFETK
jgi:hypothetical protein